MSMVKIAITIERELLERVDELVQEEIFPNRSRAIQMAVRESIERHDHSRLARECAKLDPQSEQAMADEGLAADLAEWPEY
jgi:metal-responsive CopG/Arc/MetJ family transcriptional regulator